MQMRLQRAEGSEPCGLFCTLIRWHRIVYAVLLIGMTLFPWGISSSPTAFAQGGSVNLLQNPGFETGNLSPWARWTLNPNDPGIVTIESSHIHSGTRNARIQPEGKEVVIYQTVSVIPGQKHFLSAWVSTNGMTAYLRWWSNATGVPQVCGQTNLIWPTYAYLSCELTVPAGTTSFNVQLSGNAAAGKWAVTDDWSLTKWNGIQNSGFETGSLSPWARWTLNPNDPGIVDVEDCCANHTPGGMWDAYIQPEGPEVVIYQTVSLTPGQKYFLSAWVSTNGMTAYLRWWSNATGVPQVCDQSSTVWPAYDYLSCELTVPAGTTNFNVQLSGTAPSGKWAVTDDWFLAVASPATTSRYMQTTDATTLYNLGCSRGTAGQSGVIVLDFGDPGKNPAYGAWHPSTSTFATVTQIREAAKSFLSGYWNCSPIGANITLAIGTTNAGSLSLTDLSNHGQAWAQMVNEVDTWLGTTNKRSKEAVVGASDMQLDWNSAENTRAWADGYDSVNNRPYYNFGSCEGCPYSGNPNSAPNNNWAKDDVWYVSWGVQSAWPLPEIYNTSGKNADQWYRMSLYSYSDHGLRMSFRGVLTQWDACQGQSCAGIDNTPGAGWGQLYSWLNFDSRTAQYLSWSTDISWYD